MEGSGGQPSKGRSVMMLLFFLSLRSVVGRTDRERERESPGFKWVALEGVYVGVRAAP